MGALTQGTAFQGRLAKARQPFAMMLKPVGLQIRCVPKGRPITAEDESSAQTWKGSVSLSEPTLVLPANTHRTISRNPNGVPHL